MTGTKFTKGPWSYRSLEFDDWGTVRSGHSFICQAKDGRYLSDSYLNKCRETKVDPWEANARLIAAAPELYHEGEQSSLTLEETAKVLQGMGMSGMAELCEIQAAKHRTALAKACGESTE